MPSGPTPSASRPYGDSWAIVVGINSYRKSTLRLHYAVNDAKSVTAALQKIGFPKRNIITLLDEGATARAIRPASEAIEPMPPSIPELLDIGEQRLTQKMVPL